jgi:chromosome partitioning protein
MIDKPKPCAVSLVASKGGVGKSVLAAALSVRIAKDNWRVALLDMDAQQSLTSWWKLRGRPNNPRLFSSGDPVEDVAALKSDGWQWIVIDSPPSKMELIESVIDASDVVLIPTRVSSFDLQAIRAVVDLCRKRKKIYAFVVNDADLKWATGLKSAVAHLKDLGPVVGKLVRHRTVYAQSLGVGKTGPEAADKKQAKEAAEEINEVWIAVKKMAAVTARAK